MIFAISPRAGVDPAKTEKVLYEELATLQTAEVADTELRKAKNLMLTDLYRGMKTIGGRANLLGTYEIYRGDYRKLFTAEKDIEAITAADVRRVAQKYFAPTNRTVATLIPKKAEEKGSQ
jgi:zinc protease